MVDNRVHLIGQLAVDLGNDVFNGLVGIVTDRQRVGQRLLCQGLDRVQDSRAGFVGFGFEFTLQQIREIIRRRDG